MNVLVSTLLVLGKLLLVGLDEVLGAVDRPNNVLISVSFHTLMH